jgi:hypothetical protein
MNHSLILDSQFGFQIFQLFAESGVGLAAGSFFLEQFQAIVKGPAVLLHEVGNEERRTSRNSSCAVDKDVPRLSCIIDPLVGRPEGVGDVLGVAVVEVELEVDDIFGVGEVQVHSRTHRTNIVLLQLGQVVSEIVAADPDLAEIPLPLQNSLPLGIIRPEREH